MTGLDLAARWLGGSVLAASDESFGLKESLLVEGPAVFEPGRYDHRGEIVDGWETRRRRDTHRGWDEHSRRDLHSQRDEHSRRDEHNQHLAVGGGETEALTDRHAPHDWALIRLGAPGRITEIDVDTSFFTGNFPAAVRVEALGAEGYPSVEELLAAEWSEVVQPSAVTGDSHNIFAVSDPSRYTHLRLSAYPDGGIARLRVHGAVIADPRRWHELTIEVSSAQHGARVLSSSDDFYTDAGCLIRPDTAQNMGQGWETRRRRGGGHDSVEIGLAAEAFIQQIEIDTSHFKYNASAAVQLWGLPAHGEVELLARTRLQPDTRHVFTPSCPAVPAVRSVRLDAFPDGGIARVRLSGRVSPAAILAAESRWSDALPASHASTIARLPTGSR